MSFNFVRVLCILSFTVHMVSTSPSAKCSLITNMSVAFYTIANFSGRYHRIYMHNGECYNFKDFNMENLVGSVDVYYYCVKIFDGINCEGNYLKLTSRNACQRSLAKCGMYQAKSTMLC